MQLKFKNRQKEPEPTPRWRPDYRAVTGLPDVKVVRTAFFMNAIGLTLAASIMIYLIVAEWQLHNLREQIDNWEVRISENQRKSDKAVAVNKKFQTEVDHLTEVTTFVQSAVPYTHLLLHLGSTLPKVLILESIELKDGHLDIRGHSPLPPDQASIAVTAYWEQLKQDGVLGALFDQPNLVNVTRNPATNNLTFDLLFPAKAKKKEPTK